MTTVLPYGLITISHTQNNKVNDHSHYADVIFERSNILHEFWKVYAIRHRVTKDSSDFRCQNLFWRTWRDTSLAETVTTASLTSLWHSCQQSVDVNQLRRQDINPMNKSSNDYQEIQSKSAHATYASQNIVETTNECSIPSTKTTPSQGSSSPPQSTEKMTSTYGSGGPAVNFDNSKNYSRPFRPGLHRASSSNNRASTIWSPARSKARPSVNRRKSSQSTLQSKSIKVARPPPPPPPKSPNLASREVKKVDVAPPVTTNTSTFELPSASSWEDEPAMEMNRYKDSALCTATSSDLVEPNFRNKFAERIASSNNLAGMNRMKKSGSVVRFADEVAPDLQRVKDDVAGPVLGSDRRPSLTGNGSFASFSSVAVIDEDESLPDLPRTKSQLSIMINESRSRHGRHSFESVPSPDHGSLSSRRRRDPTEEEKVLAMAHKEGVTKAGGKQIRKGFKFDNGDESRYSSPSPPTIF